MRQNTWNDLYEVQWKKEPKKEYVRQEIFKDLLNKIQKNGHPASSFNDRNEWRKRNVYIYERRGYWEHLYLGGTSGVRHIVSHLLDDTQNMQAANLGYIRDIGRRSNAIEQRIFKELNGVTERQAFGYSEPLLNKCVPKQLYYINTRWLNKKITCAGKADFSSHYPASICGPLPNWDKRIIISGTVKPDHKYPFAFYTKSGHLAEYRTFDTHTWLNENICSELFGRNYSPIDPEKDISILCPASDYRLDSTIEYLYNEKQAGRYIDDLPAKTILNSSIGYKHIKGEYNYRNRLYHLAAICIGRANQKMIDLYNENYRIVLQIVVDCIIYLGPHELGTHDKKLGALHQEITDHSYIMRGVNQYMFIDRKSGICSCHAHGAFDMNLETNKLEDIFLWKRSGKE